MNINDLIDRVAKLDSSLAKDLSEYVRGREYGLVYEASKPEFVRLWNKPVVRGDLVNVLPQRGVMEKIDGEDSPSMITYRLIKKYGDTAVLRDIRTNDECEVPLENLVAVARFDQPIYCGLKETGRVEYGKDKPYQVVINGENFHALQTLVYAYAGKVDCIYIDPPYNTGAKDWKYNNDYVSGEDVYRHSKWLTFIEDRLKVAKKLLNPASSVLIVTIDEKEYLRLGMLLEQLFPEGDIQMISSNIAQKGVARQGSFYRVNEYIYIVRFGNMNVQPQELSAEWQLGNKSSAASNGIVWSQLRRSGTNDLRSDRPNLFYPIIFNADGTKIIGVGQSLEMDKHPISPVEVHGEELWLWPIKADGTEGNWQHSSASVLSLVEKGYIKIGKRKEDTIPVSFLKKGSIEKIESGKVQVIGREPVSGTIITNNDGYVHKFIPGSQWNIESHDATYHGTQLLTKFLPDRRFPFPKSLYAVEDVLRFFLSGKSDALVVDFFSGSGTTAHAVMRLNHQDGGRRRSISVTNNELAYDEQLKLTQRGLRQGDVEWEQYGIARYITEPRIRAAITGKTPEGIPIAGNYKFIDEFPIAKGFEENAIFYDLIYLEPSIVAANLAFDDIAPILWLQSGCKSRILNYTDGYALGEVYAILFDYSLVKEFIYKVRNSDTIKFVYIITDIKNRYRSMCAELPKHEVVQLYESYLQSFEINTEV